MVKLFNIMESGLRQNRVHTWRESNRSQNNVVERNKIAVGPEKMKKKSLIEIKKYERVLMPLCCIGINNNIGKYILYDTTKRTISLRNNGHFPPSECKRLLLLIPH